MNIVKDLNNDKETREKEEDIDFYVVHPEECRLRPLGFGKSSLVHYVEVCYTLQVIAHPHTNKRAYK